MEDTVYIPAAWIYLILHDALWFACLVCLVERALYVNMIYFSLALLFSLSSAFSFALLVEIIVFTHISSTTLL